MVACRREKLTYMRVGLAYLRILHWVGLRSAREYGYHHSARGNHCVGWERQVMVGTGTYANIGGLRGFTRLALWKRMVRRENLIR